jgi:hypothetical protein
MTTIPQLATALQDVLIIAADKAGRQTGFVRRKDAKLTGSIFTQTLVFGLGANPHASLSELVATTAALGVTVTVEALHQRFTEAAALCLEQVLTATVRQLIAAEPLVLPLLERFTEVVVQDSTTIILPELLAAYWRGCGGDPNAGNAALKLQLALDLRTGRLRGPQLHDGRESDRNASLEHDLPAGALRIVDLGYWDLDTLDRLHDRGVYWFSRAQATTAVQSADGNWWSLLALLQAQGQTRFDQWVRLGKQAQVKARLLALRLPAQVVAKRRRRLRAEAKEAGEPEPTLRLALAAWAIYVTTIPAQLLSVEEALLLGAARWQIELLIKLWKSHGEIDLVRDVNPWRVLCELYGRLLGQIVQHWVILVSCWDQAGRSQTKAAQTLRGHWLCLATSLRVVERLREALTTVARCMRAVCRMNPRKGRPNTYQRFLAATASCPT